MPFIKWNIVYRIQSKIISHLHFDLDILLILDDKQKWITYNPAIAVAEVAQTK